MCRMWELSGIPYVYSVARYMFLNKEPDEGVDHWYNQEKWFKAYKLSIKPIYCNNKCIKQDNPPLLLAIIRRMPGIPRNNRVKGGRVGGRGEPSGGEGEPNGGRGQASVGKEDGGAGRGNGGQGRGVIGQGRVQTTPKGKTIEPSASAEPPTMKKQGRKWKEADTSDAIPSRIYHKNMGRSERIFNQEIKKTRFGKNGEGSTADKAFSL
ncbi:hypothetical protein Tco_1091910 [Tanacetum coccineum]|uniref:Uncharacterized protein n=1 Tax=Tanacetum coccineum TaxID=301880 RepID=A0ABQ5I8C4_9ASTR